MIINILLIVFIIYSITSSIVIYRMTVREENLEEFYETKLDLIEQN